MQSFQPNQQYLKGIIMITDYQATLSNAQALTATANSTNLYDTGSVYDSGRGIETLGVMVSVDVAADFTTGDETYSFTVTTDNDVAFGSATTLVTKTVLASALAAGDKVILPIGVGVEQYVRVTYTLGGTSPSATVTTELKAMTDIATETQNLPSGYTVTV